MSNPDPTQQPPTSSTLNPQTAAAIFRMVDRRNELKQSAIATPERDAELQAIAKQLPPLLDRHALDLIQAWFILQREHAPLVRALAPIVGRTVESVVRPMIGALYEDIQSMVRAASVPLEDSRGPTNEPAL